MGKQVRLKLMQWTLESGREIGYGVDFFVSH